MVASVYIKNNPDVELTTDLEKLIENHHSIIIGGDLNAKHKHWNYNSNQTGKRLVAFTDKNGFDIFAHPSPTCFIHKTSFSTIGLFLARDFPFTATIEAIPELNSDHNLVICTFRYKNHLGKATTFVKTDWAKMNEEFEKN